MADNSKNSIERNDSISLSFTFDSDKKKVSKKNIDTREVLKERKNKIINLFASFFKSSYWVLIVLILLVIFGVYIRSLPMTDHNGRPGLWDITTNSWTLGPDLDPWLFLRNAKTIIEQGSLPERDYMRNMPLGFDNSVESKLLPYMIAWTYKILKFIGIDKGIEFAGVIFPVIMFALTIISFFLFVREIFIGEKTKLRLKSNLIAIIASLFMVVIPIFLSRTVAGIPEKESAAFFFMFLSFYLFLRAWKSKNLKNSVMFGILAGISTGIMGIIWGGFIYVFISVGMASFIAFMFNKVNIKEFIVYFLFIVISFLIIFNFGPSKYDFLETIASFLTLFVITIHFLFFNTRFNNKISNFKLIKENKIPKQVFSLIITIFILIIVAIIFFGPFLFIEKIKIIYRVIFEPFYGRFNLTVSENLTPDFQELSENFGPFVKNIPLMFWLFFAGSVILFMKTVGFLKKKDKWILTFFYILFLSGMIFSSESFVRKAFYFITFLLFAIVLTYYYFKYFYNKHGGFTSIKFDFLLLFCLFILTLFIARGAIRFIMILAPISSILVSFLIVESIDKYFKTKDELWKTLLAVIVILILISSVYSFFIFYKNVKDGAYNYIPSAYYIQWQKAMEWVRQNTNENAVFGHWWDYGYWLQGIGNRATILDGGNAIGYWNYLMGRYVLTGDNQNDALEFLYNHNTTHLLIDSTDIGKYGTFSSIGSNKDFDRRSWSTIFLLDEEKTKKIDDKTFLVYPGGGFALDEDLIVNQNGREILLPAHRAGIFAVIISFQNLENSSKNDLENFEQPYMIIFYNGQQYDIKLRYLYFREKLIDFENGTEATVFIFPRVFEASSESVKLNEVGAMLYLSPRMMKGFLTQVYILNDPFNRFPNFKLVHNEPALNVDYLINQGLQLSDFIYLNGVHGPIKIWEVKYTGKEKIKQEYLDTDETKYLDFVL